MLRRLKIRGFKSLEDVEIEFPPLSVIFGPNTAGKSNIVDALQVLSRVTTERTLAEALTDPVRGLPIEAFTFPSGGLPELLEQDSASFELEVDIEPRPKEKGRRPDTLRYRLTTQIEPKGGGLTVRDEYLVRLDRKGRPKNKPRIERAGDQLHVRRLSEAGHPEYVEVGLNHTLVSDPRRSGQRYADFDRMRDELEAWRTYYLDPRVAMRAAQTPREVNDIGPLGEHLASFLYRLKHHERHGRRFRAIERAVRSTIPSVDSIDVDLDERRGTLDIQVVQDGTPYSSRIVSEGTLRVMALCAIAVNPWPGALIAFEEPENGVHPRRLEVIADLLASMALAGERQIIVTTHSPLFAAAMRRRQQKEKPGVVGLFVCRREAGHTRVDPFRPDGPLMEGVEIREALEDRQEDGAFEAALLRGWIDG